MKLHRFLACTSITCCMLLATTRAAAQDSAARYKLVLDTSLFNSISVVSISNLSPIGYINHFPDAKDRRNVKRYASLIKGQPDKNNYDRYSRVACSLWHLNRIDEAERMFSTIIRSKAPYYTSTRFHSAGNIYEYGSFTSNYKNKAALYLCRIAVEKKDYTAALNYLNDAVTRYRVYFTCGTGANWMQDEYDNLFALCYSGLKQYSKLLELLLPKSMIRDNELLIETIKKMYSPAEAGQELKAAEASMQCETDSFTSLSYSETPDGKMMDSIYYYSGRAQVKLFGIDVPLHTPDLKNGERATRELFLREFRESQLYLAIAGFAGLRQDE